MYHFGIFSKLRPLFRNLDLTPGSSRCWAVRWFFFVGGHTCDPHWAPFRCPPAGTMRGTARRTRVTPANHGKVKVKTFFLYLVFKKVGSQGVLLWSGHIRGPEWNILTIFTKKKMFFFVFQGLFAVKFHAKHQSGEAQDRAAFHQLPGQIAISKNRLPPEGESVVSYDLWSRTLGITTYQDSWQKGIAFVPKMSVCMYVCRVL